PLGLPPSRKTRALLAYLALTGKPFRREHLCELLWEIPDDPRGSLRWSLSKLRRLVDDEARERIVADRLTVRFDATDVGVDVAALATIAHGKLDEAPLAELEEAAARYCGTPLEGLDLPTFHDYSAWYMGERERATANQARVLNALLKRLAGDPQRAVEHARTLVRIAPYDEKVRATLIRLLMTLGRPDQAEQHYQMGSRLLKEAGATPTGELFRAWRGAPGAEAPAPTARDGGSAANAGRNLRPSAPAARQARAAPSQAPTARVAQDSKSTAGEPRLIGRDSELERLRTAMTTAFETRRCR